MPTSRSLIKISPSILAGDFGHLSDEAKKAEDAGVESLHLDIMDGHFVPNLSMGPQAVAAINRATDLFLDVHLMIYNPFDMVERFIESGADSITFHLEATEDVEETLAYIRKCNVKAGLSINPETTPSLLTRYLDKCDQFLFMSVHPGFGGQELIPEVLEKVRFIRDICNKLQIREGGVTEKREGNACFTRPPFEIQIDGGINHENVASCVEAGANVIVAGTSLYHAKDFKSAVEQMRSIAEKGVVKGDYEYYK